MYVSSTSTVKVRSQEQLLLMMATALRSAQQRLPLARGVMPITCLLGTGRLAEKTEVSADLCSEITESQTLALLCELLRVICSSRRSII